MSVPDPRKPSKPRSWLEKVETRDEALQAIKECAYVFFVLAAIGLIVGIVTAAEIWLGAVSVLVLATILLRFKSRVAAILLLIQVSVGLLVAVLASGRLVGGGIIDLLMIVAGVRSIHATFFYRSRFDGRQD